MSLAKIVILNLLLLFACTTHGQNRKSHFHLFSNFGAFEARTGGLDDFGNAYLVLYHTQALEFNNDTVEALNPNGSSVTICKIKPNGDLIWFSQGAGNTISSDLVLDDDHLYFYGSFIDTIIWNGVTLIESNPYDSLFDSDIYLIKIGLDGKFEYVKSFPDNINNISNLVAKNNSLYYTGRFENYVILGNDTLIEDAQSNQNNSNDIFLGKLDENGDHIFTTYLGSPSQQILRDLVINDTSIISYGYYIATPPFAPLIVAPSFLYVQFDTLGNVLNYRGLNLSISQPLMSIGTNINLELITREFNDSAENQILANTIYGGQNHVGFYKYSLGAFSPPNDGIAYGGSIVELPNNSDEKISYSGNLISNFISHPMGITYDGVNQINSPYSIMAFNSKKMDVEYVEECSGELNEISVNQGIQLFSGLLLDSLLQIDTLQIVNTPLVSEYLIYYTGDCDFFKPERVIDQVGDSLHIQKGELEIEWYKDNGTAVPNSLNEESIRLVGAGTYYAELRNYFGCKYYSDTVNIVSGINDEEYYSDVLAYPNPTTGDLHLDLNEPVKRDFLLTITDVNGRMIRSEKLSEQFNIIDISPLPSGLYFYELENESQRYRGKVVKQ